MQNRVTLKDIATALNVSTTTVSKALNGDSKISAETQDLVRKRAQEMGYTPNHLARAMSFKGAKIGAIFIRHPYEYTLQIEYGCYQALQEIADYNISLIAKYASNILAEDEIASALLELIEENVDGIVLFGISHHNFRFDDIFKEIRAKKIPFIITTGCSTPNPSLGQINMDVDIVSRIAAQFLAIALPPKAPVVLLSGVTEVSHTYQSSLVFMQAVYEQGLTFLGSHSTNDDEHIAYYITEKLLSSKPEIRGIYVNHFNSISVCKCLQDHNRTDIVVVGHDLFPELADQLEAGALDATIFSDPCEIGKRAISRIVSSLLGDANPNVYFTDLIPPILVIKANLPCYRDYVNTFRRISPTGTFPEKFEGRN